MPFQFKVDDVQNFLGAMTHAKLTTKEDQEAFTAIVKESGFIRSASPEAKARWEANPYVFTLPAGVSKEKLEELMQKTGAGGFTEFKSPSMKL